MKIVNTSAGQSVGFMLGHGLRNHVELRPGENLIEGEQLEKLLKHPMLKAYRDRGVLVYSTPKRASKATALTPPSVDE